MDHQNQKRLNKKQFSKITIQFIFSVSAFYIIVWYSSSFFTIHPQSFNAYFFSTSLFTHTLQRKYMFLICNGILAFLAKNSLINSSPSPSPLLSDSHFEFVNLSDTKALVSDDMVVVPLESSSESPEENHVMAEQQEENCEEALEAEEQKEEEESEACMEEEEEEKEVIKIKGVETESEVKLTQDEDELVEEIIMTGNEESGNTEDLNRKFEEFIRKMKEEMRIEPQRHLIAV